jgi:WD40 repeat protein
MPSPNADDPVRTTDHAPASNPETPPETATHDSRPAPSAGKATATFRPEEGELRYGASAAPAGQPLPSVPGYEIEAVLGRGGMGVVYRARDLALKRTVALKMVLAGGHAGPRELARFRLEAEAVARLQHPNIVQIHEVGEADGHPYCALEFVEGGSLAGRIDGKPLAARDAAKLVEALARAVQLAHSRNVVHRDLKPANVLLAADGTPKITDFGLARQLDSDSGQTQAGQVMGTPSYMAPEQASGSSHEAGPAADIYALGAILYECLAGRPPFQGKTVFETLNQVRTGEPARLPAGAPPDLATICLKCLRKEPERRYASAAELADDLVRYQRGEPIQARPVGRIERAWKLVKRNPVVTTAAAITVLALVGGLTFSFMKYREAEAARGTATDALGKATDALGKRDEALRKADEAINNEKARVKERDYQLGISNFLLAGAAYDNRDLTLAAERLDGVPEGQRGWEWRYLKQQTRGGLFTLYGHTGPVSCVAYSPDGTRIVTAGGDQEEPGEVKVWDARTGTLPLDLKGVPILHGLNVPRLCAAFSPDGARIVACGGGETARVWDARTGAALLTLKEPGAEVVCAAYSPDGARIVIGSGEGAKVWDARTGTALVELKGRSGWVNGAAFSPDGARIAGACDEALMVWDAQTGAALFDVKGIASFEGAVAFSPDGARIVTGNHEGTTTVIDAQTGTVRLELKGHTRQAHQFLVTSGVESASFSPDGGRIVTVGGIDASGEARVWDARTGAELLELNGHTSLVMSAAFSPDGEHIVTGSLDGTAKVWDARTGTPRLALKGRADPSCVAFRPDGARIVTGGADLTVNVWDAATGKAIVALKGFMGGAAAISPDGARIVTGGWDHMVKVWDARTGTALLELKGHTGDVNRVAFSPDGARIMSCDGSMAKVWDAKAGAFLFDLKEVGGWLTSFSPDGARIVAGHGTTAKVYDGKTGMDLVELNGHSGQVTSVAFSPDGARIVTGAFSNMGQAGEAKLWDTKTGAFLFDLKGIPLAKDYFPGVSVAFSPDGARIAAANGRAEKVWDAKTGTEVVELNGQPGSINQAAFSPDSTRIVTTGFKRDKSQAGEGAATVWDAKTGTALLELQGHPGPVLSVAFSPDGERIVTGSGGARGGPVGELRVWDAQTGEALFVLQGFRQAPRDVSFSPDGTEFVVGAVRQEQTATVWDAQAGTALLELKGGPGGVRGVSFSPDGTRIVAGGGCYDGPGTATVWDARTGAALVELKGFKEVLYSAAYSPDGARVVTGGTINGTSGGSEVKVWDARTGAVLLDLTPPHREMGFLGGAKGVSVAFSPDGTRIVAGCLREMENLGSQARVWDAQTGTILLDLKGHKGAVQCVAFSPDGTRLVTGGSDNTAKVWDAQKGTLLFDLKGHTGDVNSVAFSPDPDGARIVTGSSDRTVRVWDARTGTALVELKGPAGWVNGVAFSPDGTRLVAACSREVGKPVEQRRPGEAIVWAPRPGPAVVELKGHTEGILRVAFSPDGARVATGSYDKTVKVWDVKTGATLLDLKGFSSLVASLAFSPDGTRLVAGGDTPVKVWDAQTGTVLLELKGHPGDAAHVAFSPDGTRIVAGGSRKGGSDAGQGVATVWDAATGTALYELGGHTIFLDSVAFTPDGFRIVTRDRDATEKVWDVQTGKELVGESIPETLRPGRISPDGRVFARTVGERVELISLKPDAEELDYRMIHTRPEVWRYREGFEAARAARDDFTARFYLKLLAPAEREVLEALIKVDAAPPPEKK